MLAYGLSLLLVGSDGILCLWAVLRCLVSLIVIMSEKSAGSGRNQPLYFLRDRHIRGGGDAGIAGLETAGPDDVTCFTDMSGIHLAVWSCCQERTRDSVAEC